MAGGSSARSGHFLHLLTEEKLGLDSRNAAFMRGAEVLSK